MADQPNPQPTRTWTVMHQVVTTVIVFSCLVVAPAAQARAGESEAAATIARVPRLIDAKDYASATTLLEDLLLETNARDRATILGILASLTK